MSAETEPTPPAPDAAPATPAPAIPSRNVAAPAPLPPLPPNTERETTATYHAPNILIESKDGVDSVRRGGSHQVRIKSEIWFTETPQTEDALEIKAQNAFNFMGITVDVLNDAGQFNNQALQASVPTAAQYLARVGQRTTIKFTSTPMGDGNILRALKRPVVYVNNRISIVLP